MAEGMLVVHSDGGEIQVPMSITVASPKLSTDVPVIDFGTSINYSEVRGSLTIFNHGLGSLSGVIRPGVAWLRVDPSSFECDTGKSCQIAVYGVPADLPSGTFAEDQAVLIESNGGEASLAVRLEVILEPQLEATPVPLVLERTDASALASAQLVLRNAGYAAVRVELRPSSSCIQLQRRVYVVKPGKEVRVEIRLDVPDEETSDTLFVTILSDVDELRVPLAL
jgi:hypothetical protein